MPILPTKEKKGKLISKNLILILIAILVIGGILYFLQISTPAVPTPVSVIPPMKLGDINKIEENWKILDDSRIDSLYSFGRLPTLEETLEDIEKGIGRENPFLPH